jgi:signal transduction histidine kinase
VWLTTDGIEFLPSIMADPVHPQLAWHFIPLVVLSLIAMALLWVRRQSALDLWLLVVLEAWMLNALLFNRLVARWSVFWYCGRVFAALATIVILIFLLSETTVLYWRLARSHTMLERERDNRLMNAQAITAAIAHEIRQPLAAIVTNANAALRWLGRAPPDHDEVGAALNRIKYDGHRTSEVFDGIRALLGKADQAKHPIDMNEIILGVMRSMQGQLRHHGVAAHPDLTTELPLIKGHRAQLQQVIFNLINNAIEAMDITTDRSRVLHVRTELRGREAITVAIKDSGPGIDPNKLDHIFRAFVTTKARGTGLGLAICRMIVEHHGGQLTALSDGKSGALFQFVLPIEPTENAAASA